MKARRWHIVVTMLNPRFVHLFGSFALLAIGFGAGMGWHSTRPKSSGDAASVGRSRDREPQPIRVVRVEPRGLEERVIASGTVRASERVMWKSWKG